MKVPFVDLSYMNNTPVIYGAIREVARHGRFILGPEVAEFESAFADYCESQHCIGVASGTDALFLSLKVLCVGPGDEVITAANSYVSSAFAASYCGAQPVLVDCDPDDFTIDADQLKQAITERTKAIIPVHLAGHPANMDAICEIAKEHGISVVEDAAQAHGARFQDRRVGSLGNLACFSFYPSKNLGAFGAGGAITTNNAEFAEQLRLWRAFGERTKYHHELMGFNSRLDTIQAAVLGMKLPQLDYWNALRRERAGEYLARFADVDDVDLPIVREGVEHVFYTFMIRVDRRDELQEHLKTKGIETVIHFPIPIHEQQAYRGIIEGSFPVAESNARRLLSIPMFPNLHFKQIEYVVESIKEFYRE